MEKTYDHINFEYVFIVHFNFKTIKFISAKGFKLNLNAYLPLQISWWNFSMHVNFCFNKIYLIGILELTLKCDIQPNTGSNPLTHKPCQPSAAELDVRVTKACWVGSAVVLLKIIKKKSTSPYTCWRVIKKGSSPIVWIKNVTLLKVVNAQESGHPLSWLNV